MSPVHVVAIADHEIPTRPALRIAPGDVAEVGENDTTWPAFVFVTTASGTGWVPERHLGTERPTTTVVTAYNTRELPVSAQDELTVHEDDPESGWSWCTNRDGHAGWVPHTVLRNSED
ncbi:hypothetical protein J4H86_12220 [Spiractinospora alimapuensis]|uniref:SH3 domain-containing protein n=1 Tax=Spiractinospora alimapuensis TaxID=2820884 RepID=UPI001F401AC9|nr:SH3 domain-containing protein [Spiractinospora alimapuensis]QVQ54370.1 hypothetical protein J4H86_12220 [Spiractinospora alimapuensis]